jgi:hypothetical protein
MRTRVVSLAAAIALIPLVGLATASPASAAINPDGALTVTPSAVPVGTGATVTVEASWVGSDFPQTETVLTMPQALLDAGATWSSAMLSSNPNALCVLDDMTRPREAACLWVPTPDPNNPFNPVSTTMKAVLQLPAGVAAGAYAFEALAVAEAPPGRTVTLTVSAPTTASPSPSPSASASASSSPVPTAVPAGEGPSSGSGGLPLLPLVVVLAVAGGGAWVLVRSRA